MAKLSEWVTEFKLLLIACFCLCAGLLSVSLSRGAFDSTALGMPLAITVTVNIASYLNYKLYRGDPFILPAAVFLSGIGLTIIYRLVPGKFFMQGIWVILGIVLFSAAAYALKKVDKFSEYKYICGFVAITLLLMTIVFGENIGGHIAWIKIGLFRIQPTEIAKLFIIFFLAAYLSERSELLMFANRKYGGWEIPPLRFLAPLVLLCLLTMLLLVCQRDLGAALMYFGITIGMTYLASNRLYYVLAGLGLFLFGSVICYKIYAHVQTRVDVWLNPWHDPTNEGYQVIQSLFAFGSGGVMGSGLTFGFPDLIPEVETDFILAAIGEEMGFIGTAAVLLAYILIIYRAFVIALMAASRFRRLVAGGIAIFLGLQVFLIAGGVTKFFPLTGITLPFISYGGSSMVSDYILFAVLYAVSEVRADGQKLC